MTFINSRLMLSTAALAAAVLLAPGSGMSTTLGVSAANPIEPQAGFAADASPVILAKDKGLKCCGKGGHHHHHHSHRRPHLHNFQ